jgi:hypothetical protein
MINANYPQIRDHYNIEIICSDILNCVEKLDMEPPAAYFHKEGYAGKEWHNSWEQE